MGQDNENSLMTELLPYAKLKVSKGLKYCPLYIYGVHLRICLFENCPADHRLMQNHSEVWQTGENVQNGNAG